MEMQWVHAPLINTGEFFHGPFEIVDRTTPFVLFMSDGRNRSNDERAKKFLDEYADRVTVLDAKELYINQFPQASASSSITLCLMRHSVGSCLHSGISGNTI